MNKEILELVTKIFTFLKLEDYTKLTNILSMIEKEFPNYYKFFEKFKDKSMGEKASNVLSNIFESLTLGGTPLALLGKKAEKEEKEREITSEKNSLKDGIKKFLKIILIQVKKKDFLEFFIRKVIIFGRNYEEKKIFIFKHITIFIYQYFRICS